MTRKPEARGRLGTRAVAVDWGGVGGGAELLRALRVFFVKR